MTTARDSKDHHRERFPTYAPGGAAVGLPLRELLLLMREDWISHGRRYSHAGLHAVLIQRLGAWRLGMPRGPLRYALAALYRTLHVFARNLYGIELYDRTRLGRRVVVAHQSGIVIGASAEIGDGSTIRQNVTIGQAFRNGGEPRLGREIDIGAGAAIIGPVAVGDGAKIGPNAIVVSDIPPGATAFASPARQMPPRRAAPTSPERDSRA